MKRLLLWLVPLVLLVTTIMLYTSNQPSGETKTDVMSLIEEVTLPELVKKSSGILIGRVAKVIDPYLVIQDGPPDENPPAPLQEATIEVERWLVNSKNFPNRFNISWLGGTVQLEKEIMESEQLVSLKEGDRILLFVGKTTFYGKYPRIVPNGYFQGIFRLSGENGISRHPDGTVDRKTTLGEVNKLIKELRSQHI